MSKNKVVFKNMASLGAVQRVVNEAKDALNNSNSTIKGSPLAAAMAAPLFSFDLIGPIGLPMFPMYFYNFARAVLDCTWMVLAPRRHRERMRQSKVKMLEDAIRARDAIISKLQSDVKLSKDHVEHLKAINTLLQAAVRDLKADLAA